MYNTAYSKAEPDLALFGMVVAQLPTEDVRPADLSVIPVADAAPAAVTVEHGPPLVTARPTVQANSAWYENNGRYRYRHQRWGGWGDGKRRARGREERGP